MARNKTKETVRVALVLEEVPLLCAALRAMSGSRLEIIALEIEQAADRHRQRQRR
jgi:uncharacterized protein YPO0396